MEILSTGEKIKRARVYKGYTLKDVCEEKVSVSKMSCIENGKVQPEQWILEFVAEKLDIELNYINEDVKFQIEKNIEFLSKSKSYENYEKDLQYNLSFAEEYGYCDLVFQLYHLLFHYYLDQNESEKLHILSSKYYDAYQKSASEENELTYYMDIGRYLYSNKEYLQAANYYSNIRKMAEEKGEFTVLSKATYNEAACYVMVEDYEKAYGIGMHLSELLKYVEDDLKKAEIYHMLAVLSLRMDKGKFEYFEQKSYEFYKSNLLYKAKAIYNYAAVMFEVGLREKAITYIHMGLECYPRDEKEDLVQFMLINVGVLNENQVMDLAQELCDEALNYAIDLDNIRYIEKSYYYKALILEKQNNLYAAEMYANLALDALMKFANKQELYKRYMEMGNLYYSLNNTAESIKYFNLAIALEKKI